MARISRRALLSGGVALAAVPTGFAARCAAAPRVDVVVNYLHHLLPGLTMPDAEIRAFAETCISRIDPENRRKLYFDFMFAVMANPVLESALPGRARTAYDYVTRNLLTTFLLSTDFFAEARQRPERTRYIAFSDPYEMGCRNSIARFEA